MWHNSEITLDEYKNNKDYLGELIKKAIEKRNIDV